jgi:hypothetical protein
MSATGHEHVLTEAMVHTYIQVYKAPVRPHQKIFTNEYISPGHIFGGSRYAIIYLILLCSLIGSKNCNLLMVSVLIVFSILLE